jgi:ubiquinone/menaquinone biosynthesis C-methylase UbiE
MDKGYLDTSTIIKSGITHGIALEIGPGPGYLGIDWLIKTENTQLKGIDISPDMLARAKMNAGEYNLENRTEYVLGNAKKIPYENETFDAVFTNGSMHEWSEPAEIFKEIYRVLKKGGRYCITDLRRDISIIARLMIQMVIPKERKEGFLSSLYASYTKNEMENLIKGTELVKSKVNSALWTLEITGTKE